jgi:hypothetical protein
MTYGMNCFVSTRDYPALDLSTRERFEHRYMTRTPQWLGLRPYRRVSCSSACVYQDDCKVHCCEAVSKAIVLEIIADGGF